MDKDLRIYLTVYVRKTALEVDVKLIRYQQKKNPMGRSAMAFVDRRVGLVFYVSQQRFFPRVSFRDIYLYKV